jgi:NAD(P)H-hydrate epimerase
VALSRVRYLTAGGLEVPPVTASGMREIDRIAIEETGPHLFRMMENAGRNGAAGDRDPRAGLARARHVLGR